MINPKRGCRLHSTEIPAVGHPDKIADYISNSILSYILTQDKDGRVSIDTVVTKDTIFISGEVSAKTDIDYNEVARNSVKELGYEGISDFDFSEAEIIVKVKNQSPEIENTVNKGGAGNLCIVTGGAWNETPDYMPLPISLARELSINLTELSKKTLKGYIKQIYPDGKVLVTIAYDKDRNPVGIDTLIVNVARAKDFTRDALYSTILDKVVEPGIKKFGFEVNDIKKCYINSAGSFSVFGPDCDTGVSGRKSVSDSYGLYIPHGGSSVVGKDLTKTDTVATYFARYIAKNIVAAKLASVCEVQMSFSIGSKNPVAINLNMFGSNKFPVGIISKALYKTLDFTTEGMIRTLNIPNDFRYQNLDVYGYFGDNLLDRPWERVDLAEILRTLVKSLYESSKADF